MTVGACVATSLSLHLSLTPWHLAWAVHICLLLNTSVRELSLALYLARPVSVELQMAKLNQEDTMREWYEDLKYQQLQTQLVQTNLFYHYLVIVVAICNRSCLAKFSSSCWVCPEIGSRRLADRPRISNVIKWHDDNKSITVKADVWQERAFWNNNYCKWAKTKRQIDLSFNKMLKCFKD